MMVFNKIKIVILTLLFGVSMVSCAKEKKDCCIIFWITKPGLSFEYLDKTDYLECIEKFPDYIKIDFSEIKRFDYDCQVLVLKNELNKDRNKRIGEYDQFYVSIVVDSEIVLNGVSGERLLSARMGPEIPSEEYNLLILEKGKYLVISKNLFDEECFIKRNSIDPNVKKLISMKIK
jgi:hypothetical protein